MLAQKTDSKQKNRHERARQAIALALEGKWAAAVESNRRFVADFPDDREGYNRLGKAATEIGRYAEARAAFSRTLELDFGNLIAKKNLARLRSLVDDAPKATSGERVPPRFFIEQTGRTGIESLSDLPSNGALARVSPGERVALRAAGSRLEAVTQSGERLGRLSPRVSARLSTLMNGGNRYEGAVSSVGEDRLCVFIKETYQHPSQKGRLSFPPSRDAALSGAADGFKPYVWGGLRNAPGGFESDGGVWDANDPDAILARRARRGANGFAALANGEEEEDD